MMTGVHLVFFHMFTVVSQVMATVITDWKCTIHRSFVSISATRESPALLLFRISGKHEYHFLGHLVTSGFSEGRNGIS